MHERNYALHTFEEHGELSRKVEYQIETICLQWLGIEIHYTDIWIENLFEVYQ